MRSPMRVLPIVILAVAALTLPATASATGSGPSLGVTVTHTPDTVSASTPLMTTYFRASVTVKNTSAKAAKNVKVVDKPPAGATGVSATPSQGSCTLGAEVKCELGTLAPGATAVISLSFTSPSSPGTVANKVIASFESGHGGVFWWLHPKPQPVVVVDHIPVVLFEGAVTSWLPAGTPGDLTTSTTADEVTTASRPQVAGAVIPAQPAGEPVLLRRTAAAFACPKWQICRSGEWTEARIPNASGQPLQFELRWDASLVSYKQTVHNFAVFYRKELNSPTQVITCRCNATASVRPCLKNVKKHADGDFSVVLVRDDNGYMR
jgi:uncharacterized repeat protein (TIGR01451 family)